MALVFPFRFPRGATAGSVPVEVESGKLALNEITGRLFTRDESSGGIRELLLSTNDIVTLARAGLLEESDAPLIVTSARTGMVSAATLASELAALAAASSRYFFAETITASKTWVKPEGAPADGLVILIITSGGYGGATSPASGGTPSNANADSGSGGVSGSTIIAFRRVSDLNAAEAAIVGAGGAPNAAGGSSAFTGITAACSAHEALAGSPNQGAGGNSFVGGPGGAARSAYGTGNAGTAPGGGGGGGRTRAVYNGVGYTFTTYAGGAGARGEISIIIVG
jgi:hypothetical protein